MLHKFYEDYSLLFTLSIKENLDGLKNSYWKVNSISIDQHISTVFEDDEFF